MASPHPSVRSSDGVDLAVHDLGGAGTTLLISHATGFHGRCYAPLAHALADRFHAIAFDYRGHGDTPQPAGVPIEWVRYGQDALAMAQSLDPAIVGFGHSMGGACLLMAAHADPGRFSHLVLFEPIVFPPDAGGPPGQGNPMVDAARRRRTSFDSYTAAIDNFASKPPLSSWTAEALEEYVRGGFRIGEDGRVHLTCPPEIEAGTFELSGTHRTWELLPEIDVPVTVVAGRLDGAGPSAMALAIAERLPAATYVQGDALDHFGPMTHPDVVAELVASNPPSTA